MKREKTKPAPRPVDPADVWQEAVAGKAAKAMAAWMKGSVHLSRPLRTLTMPEMKTLAITAIHTWIVEASNRAGQKIDPDERNKLYKLLG